jgi:hypothetical protein
MENCKSAFGWNDAIQPKNRFIGAVSAFFKLKS